ncbi:MULTISPECIES: hypothetical protein [Alphaproteobacteria]|uniref:Uncharacterized protein n=2 Tax=Alphaproteobacteria TaxID=28211 RepID=A0A512HF23_9HYPH|nr:MULTISPECIES: hypothetical protein [Alphaproteobacteria]GEO84041.1 hypothetical protein RNA01_09730 [Ciceribacter naphthalenivorans]GLR21081.1 hypothetical protein GCM10007920_08670 [Ciceribacter naphthalenivorans]GLT03937.1 hypothetical protein GCM10007926_08670 [Sphingomonas psychrolutea]
MVSAIKNLWLVPGLSFGGIKRFFTRLLARGETWSDTLPDSMKKDLGLLDGRPSRSRTDAYWSDHRRHRDWIRSGPL